MDGVDSGLDATRRCYCRIEVVSMGATAAGMNRLFDGENVKDTVNYDAKRR